MVFYESFIHFVLLFGFNEFLISKNNKRGRAPWMKLSSTIALTRVAHLVSNFISHPFAQCSILGYAALSQCVGSLFTYLVNSLCMCGPSHRVAQLVSNSISHPTCPWFNPWYATIFFRCVLAFFPCIWVNSSCMCDFSYVSSLPWRGLKKKEENHGPRVLTFGIRSRTRYV